MAMVQPGVTEELTGQKVQVPQTPNKAVAPVTTTPKQPTMTATSTPNNGIDDKTMAEIKRKADAGIALVNPTDAKMNAYTGYLASKNTENANVTATSTGTSLEDAQGFAQGARDASVAGQTAQLGQARDQQITDVKKAYEDAVEQGQMSLREAEEAFRKQTEVINQQHYQDSQITNLTAEGRGIGNSQQLLGLMAGDNSRKNTMINENMTTRDKRVADINDRIRNLTLKKDLDIGQANSNYNYGVAGAQAQADMQYNNQMFGLKQSDYEAYRNQGFNQQNMATQQGYNMQNMAIQQGYNQQNMATQHGYDIAKMDKAHVQVLDQMAKQYGYDIKKMSQQQIYQLDQMRIQQGYTQQNMATQHGYDMTRQNDAQAHDSAMMDKQQGFTVANMAKQHGYDMSKISAQGRQQMSAIEAQAQQELKQYELAMTRELNKYDPKTPEGQIMQKQFQQQMDWARQEINGKARAEAEALYMKETYGGTGKPVEPQKPGFFANLFTPFGQYDKQMQQYQSDVDKWQTYQRYLQTGQMPPIK